MPKSTNWFQESFQERSSASSVCLQRALNSDSQKNTLRPQQPPLGPGAARAGSRLWHLLWETCFVGMQNTSVMGSWQLPLRCQRKAWEAKNCYRWEPCTEPLRMQCLVQPGGWSSSGDSRKIHRANSWVRCTDSCKLVSGLALVSLIFSVSHLSHLPTPSPFGMKMYNPMPTLPSYLENMYPGFILQGIAGALCLESWVTLCTAVLMLDWGNTSGL